MKKIIVAFVIFAISLSAFSACGKKEKSDTPKQDASNTSVMVKEEYFTWSREGSVSGLTEEGKKQKKLIIPKTCQNFIYGALSNNAILEEVIFESDDTVIVPDLFNGCMALKSVSLPLNITEIPKRCFARCTSLASIVIPDNVKKIDSDAFLGCTSLCFVDMGNNVEDIGSSAFFKCESLTDIKFSPSLKTIGSQAFSSNKKLKNMELPCSLESIDSSAFQYCESLESVVIPEGVKSLEGMAFTYCSSLRAIYLPSSLESISDTAIAQFQEIIVYVKEGSFADINFVGYDNGLMVKEFY